MHFFQSKFERDILQFFLSYLTELDTAGKVKRVLLTSAKLIILIGMLYLFICSLSFLTSAFRLLGGKKTGENHSYSFYINYMRLDTLFLTSLA